jgi:hypothetical protein
MNGKPIVKNVHRREELYDGRFTEEAPELVIEMNNPSGYLNGVLPSKPSGPVIRKLSDEELSGGKGSFPSGGHRKEGFYIINNQTGIFEKKLNLQIFDLTQLIYYTINSSV